MFNYHKNWLKGFFTIGAACLLLSACNKELEDPGDIRIPGNPMGINIGNGVRAIADDSLFYRIVQRAGLTAMLMDTTKSYTLWVPNNAAVKSFVAAATNNQIPVGAPNSAVSAFLQSSSFSATTAASIVMYHMSPQRWTYSTLSKDFPNVSLPSFINPAPTVSALLRLDNYPSARNGNWFNNIPVVKADEIYANGIVHHIAAVAVPPSQFLWQRIASDSRLTFLKAAVNRADSGVVKSADSLQNLLLNIGANFTVFAPTDSAFKVTLYGAVYPGVYQMVYQQAYAQFKAGGATDAQATAGATNAATQQAPTITTQMTSTIDVFKNSALFGALSAQTVKGILFYHILGKRAFLNNFPTTATSVPTLLNMAVPTHPGVTLAATIGTSGATAATVKGVANATAAKIAINPLPNGTSDQHYLNGVIHLIDQVLMPQ